MIIGAAKRQGFSGLAVDVERLSEEDRYTLLFGVQSAGASEFKLSDTADQFFKRYKSSIDAIRNALPTDELEFILGSLLCGAVHYSQRRGAELQAQYLLSGFDIARAAQAMEIEMRTNT